MQLKKRAPHQFGVAGLVAENAKVFYSSDFKSSSVGRVSDLITAKFKELNQNEFEIRALLLYSLYEAQQLHTQSLPDGDTYSATFASLEVGVDTDSMVFGIGFNWDSEIISVDKIRDQYASQAPQDLFGKILKWIGQHCHEIYLKHESSTHRIEVDTVLYFDKNVEKQAFLHVFMAQGDDHQTVQVAEYTDLADLPYRDLLGEEGKNLFKKKLESDSEIFSKKKKKKKSDIRNYNNANTDEENSTFKNIDELISKLKSSDFSEEDIDEILIQDEVPEEFSERLSGAHILKEEIKKVKALKEEEDLLRNVKALDGQPEMIEKIKNSSELDQEIIDLFDGSTDVLNDLIRIKNKNKNLDQEIKRIKNEEYFDYNVSLNEDEYLAEESDLHLNSSAESVENESGFSREIRNNDGEVIKEAEKIGSSSTAEQILENEILKKRVLELEGKLQSQEKQPEEMAEVIEFRRREGASLESEVSEKLLDDDIFADELLGDETGENRKITLLDDKIEKLSRELDYKDIKHHDEVAQLFLKINNLEKNLDLLEREKAAALRERDRFAKEVEKVSREKTVEVAGHEMTGDAGSGKPLEVSVEIRKSEDAVEPEKQQVLSNDEQSTGRKKKSSWLAKLNPFITGPSDKANQDEEVRPITTDIPFNSKSSESESVLLQARINELEVKISALEAENLKLASVATHEDRLVNGVSAGVTDSPLADSVVLATALKKLAEEDATVLNQHLDSDLEVLAAGKTHEEIAREDEIQKEAVQEKTKKTTEYISKIGELAKEDSTGVIGQVKSEMDQTGADEKSKRWVEALSKGLIQERARLAELQKSLQLEFKSMEGAYRNREGTLQSELKRRDAVLKQKDILLGRKNEQIAMLNVNFEKVKQGGAGADDAQWKHKYASAQKVVELKEIENRTLSAKVRDIENKLMIANAKVRTSTSNDQQWKQKVHVLETKIEEIKKQAQKPKDAISNVKDAVKINDRELSDMKRKLEVSDRQAVELKKTYDRAMNALREKTETERKLQLEVQKLTEDLKRAKALAVRADTKRKVS